MQLPQINLNGSDADSLARQYNDASVAVQKAITLMAPLVHGRDYQTLPDGAYVTARNEMMDRITALVNVRDQLSAIAMNIVGQ